MCLGYGGIRNQMAGNRELVFRQGFDQAFSIRNGRVVGEGECNGVP